MCQCKNPYEITVNKEVPEVKQCVKCGHSRVEPTDWEDPKARRENTILKNEIKLLRDKLSNLELKFEYQEMTVTQQKAYYDEACKQIAENIRVGARKANTPESMWTDYEKNYGKEEK